MDGTRDHHVKQSKLGSERERSHAFTHTWKLDLKGKHKHKYLHDPVNTICIEHI
jgi:hypothetical protein